MSFRSMLLLRRSSDLQNGEKSSSEDYKEPKVDGAILLVEERHQELGHLSTILESLNFRTVSLTDKALALRLIQEGSPRMVVSSQRLSSPTGYEQLGEGLRPGPFIYVPEKDSPGQQAGSDPAVTSPEEQADSVRTPDLKKARATAQEIVHDLRESEEEGSDFADLFQQDSVLEKDVKEGTDQIQSYRAQFHARQKPSEQTYESSLDDLQYFAPNLRTPREEDFPLPADHEQAPGGIFEDLAAPGLEEDYSMIERIDAEEISSLSPEDVLSEKTSETDENLYQEARSYVLNSIRAVDGGQLPELVEGESIAERVVSSIETGSELLLSATNRKQEFAITAHSVNTAVFAVRIAMSLGLGRFQQVRIALAALLHEIGVVRLPKQLIYKTEKPTLEEIKILRQRPLYAARCLKGVDSQYEWLTEVVGQVYERENGTGHPFGLTGREIGEEAKVIGIADLFDACIHKRPYREALTGYQALFELTTDQARTFSDRIVKALIKSLSLFPYNEFVLLSSGEIGKVVEINLENLSRPVVEVLFDKKGNSFEVPKSIDLAQNPSLYISKALPYRNLPS